MCPWRESYWKYAEIKNFIMLYKAQNGGMDLNRIKSLSFYDFVKISTIKDFI